MLDVKDLMIGLSAVMLTGPSLVSVSVDLLIALGFPSKLHSLVMLLNQVVCVALGLTILFGRLDLIKMFLRSLRRNVTLTL
jgi:hypothetical protein